MKAGGALLAPPTHPPGGMGLSDCLPARGTQGTEGAAHRGRCFRVSPRGATPSLALRVCRAACWRTTLGGRRARG
jgi:hypothetical protein